ncbi:glutathione-dependent formaldehyde-activating, GFA [Microthyrium microscopicum]|uniref:Glutathione-dependent formaldehyde-activating, GFA n=1 Tax=Microthyrium microscopicum TaxID=703497 RepID=A0A6A6UR01_9PEZI|nr:glutathione-dependent formaldehyde-activating, GFA [Microthyrium microscopicum]
MAAVDTRSRPIYHANCHCGSVQITAKILSLAEYPVCDCNCSICTKNGYLLVYPKREDFKITAGAESLSQYLFGLKNKPHNFCKLCGTSMFIDFSQSDVESQREHIALNARTIVDIEEIMDTLKRNKFDGKRELGPVYEAPTPAKGT